MIVWLWLTDNQVQWSILLYSILLSKSQSGLTKIHRSTHTNSHSLWEHSLYLDSLSSIIAHQQHCIIFSLTDWSHLWSEAGDIWHSEGQKMSEKKSILPPPWCTAETAKLIFQQSHAAPQTQSMFYEISPFHFLLKGDTTVTFYVTGGHTMAEYIWTCSSCYLDDSN